MYEYHYSRNDGIYVVVDGAEYILTSLTFNGVGTKCEQCDLYGYGKCRAPAWCLKVEVEFPDSFWKRTSSIYNECNGGKSIGTYYYADSVDNGVQTISTNAYNQISDTISVDFGQATNLNI